MKIMETFANWMVFHVEQSADYIYDVGMMMSKRDTCTPSQSLLQIEIGAQWLRNGNLFNLCVLDRDTANDYGIRFTTSVRAFNGLYLYWEPVTNL